MDASPSFDDLVRARRSPQGLRYEKYMDSLKATLESLDQKDVETVRRANDGFLKLKDVTPGTVHQNATLSTVSIQYANEEYIGEQLMPIAPVGKKSDVYYIYDKRSRLAYPDDALGPRGQANEVSDGRGTASYACVPRGFENYVDGETLENQDAPLNEMVDLVEAINEGLAFQREKRIADVLTTGANFGSNTTAIAAGSRWDTAGGGNPIKDIQSAVKEIWSGRGPSDLVAYSDYDTYLTLSRHPAILDLFKYGGMSPGLASAEMIAKFFGLSKYLVGKSRQDTANPGQSASYSRIWGKCFGIVRVARRPSIRTASFGYTFRHGQPTTMQWFDPRRGKIGGYFAKVTVSEDHKVVASDTGFLLTTPIS